MARNQHLDSSLLAEVRVGAHAPSGKDKVGQEVNNWPVRFGASVRLSMQAYRKLIEQAQQVLPALQVVPDKGAKKLSEILETFIPRVVLSDAASVPGRKSAPVRRSSACLSYGHHPQEQSQETH
jgi:hypothetical protein